MAFTTLDTSQLKKLMIMIKICSVNPLYLLISHENGYIQEKGGNKYLDFDSTDENKELLEKYKDVFNGVRDNIKEVSDSECDYEKDYMKIKFNSDDNSKDLLLNKMVNFIRKSF